MSLPRAPRAVIFDMDGLLFDTEALYQRSFVDIAKLPMYAVSSDVIALMIGVPWVRGRELMLERLGDRFPIDEYYRRVVMRFEELSETDLKVKPGVIELLDLLDVRGLPRCIATSSAHGTVNAHLARYDMSSRFDAVVGHGDYENSKPSPDPYLVAARRLAVPASACLALEDSFTGVRSAAAAGMMTIMVPDIVAPTPDIRSLCVCIADSLHDVAALVARTSVSSAPR